MDYTDVDALAFAALGPTWRPGSDMPNYVETASHVDEFFSENDPLSNIKKSVSKVAEKPLLTTQKSYRKLSELRAKLLKGKTRVDVGAEAVSSVGWLATGAQWGILLAQLLHPISALAVSVAAHFGIVSGFASGADVHLSNRKIEKINTSLQDLQQLKKENSIGTLGRVCDDPDNLKKHLVTVGSKKLQPQIHRINEVVQVYQLHPKSEEIATKTRASLLGRLKDKLTLHNIIRVAAVVTVVATALLVFFPPLAPVTLFGLAYLTISVQTGMAYGAMGLLIAGFIYDKFISSRRFQRDIAALEAQAKKIEEMQKQTDPVKKRENLWAQEIERISRETKKLEAERLGKVKQKRLKGKDKVLWEKRLHLQQHMLNWQRELLEKYSFAKTDPLKAVTAIQSEIDALKHNVHDINQTATELENWEKVAEKMRADMSALKLNLERAGSSKATKLNEVQRKLLQNLQDDMRAKNKRMYSSFIKWQKQLLGQFKGEDSSNPEEMAKILIRELRILDAHREHIEEKARFALALSIALEESEEPQEAQQAA